MEPITAWSEERVSQWLQGLDAPLQQYPTSAWHLTGMDLLQLTSKDLENLGVNKIGHQELILEAVEKLCFLMYGIGGESLRSVTEKLRAVSQSLQMGIQSRWRINGYDGGSTTKLPTGVLQLVVELITSAKGLFSLLNRYQFFQLSGGAISKTIFSYCKELGDIVNKDSTVYEKEKDIISVCRQVTAACDDILTTSPEAILTHTAQLESVDLVPVSPGDKLGIEIASTDSSNHYVTGAAAEPSSDVYLKILAGDEVIQVNDQIVVGWSRANLIKKLQENPSGVTLVLKKIPESAESSEEEEEKDEENLRHSLFERVAASVRSLSFSHSTFVLDSSIKSSLLSYSHILGFAGQTTAMSRRRVSCRELGKPDCDGWLWKKRKESSVFLAQKWQRFWFVLKGPALYWYSSQQDEKAEGFVNISSYSIESAGEHKRKYVFKMCHQRFQNFFFAADNVNDMSKWINYLITTIQKHKKQKGPDSEEECYSETESESERSPSPRRKKVTKVQSNTLPRQKWKNRAPLPSPLTGSSKGTVDEMGVMMNSIKEGGVSLTGQEQPFTHDHFRRSFIRRCKNPVINEKVHTLRTLQSTLKAKEAELLQINKILDDSEVTASKFRQWKEQNEELVQEIERTTSLKASKDGDPTAEKGAYRWSLSDGEQLVDAEPSDVLLEMGSPGLETSPMLELSLGSLQESINKDKCSFF
uniref:Connector enhancer of kinase suppressor of Ras 1 n=1 Tax=Takifugu rubripes TaxID=31033 RepID=A0A674PKC1_TAKRU